MLYWNDMTKQYNENHIFRCLDTLSKQRFYRCILCKAPHATKRCSGCRIYKYCSVKCQQNDWNQHKDECKNLRQCFEKCNADIARFDQEMMIYYEENAQTEVPRQQPKLKHTIWTTMIAKILLGTSRDWINNKNQLAIDLVLMLCETILQTDITLTMRRFINGMLPSILLSSGRIYDSYRFLTSREYLISSSVKSFSYIYQKYDNKRCIVDVAKRGNNILENCDAFMIFSSAFIKTIIKLRSAEIKALASSIMGSRSLNGTIQDNIASYLGAPINWRKVNLNDLERQSMELLKMVHVKNKTILRSAINLRRVIRPSFTLSLRAFLCYQEWKSEKEAFKFLVQIANDIIIAQ